MTPERNPAPTKTPLSRAADWYARKRSGAMSLSEARELEIWLASDAAHRTAFAEIEQVWADGDDARADPDILAMREEALAERTSPRAMIAAAALLAVLGVGGWAAWRFDLIDAKPAAPPEQEYATGIGQTATVTLSDGTMVTLDTNTRLRARETDGKRLAFLDHGRAFFRVAKNPERPFVVTASGKTVTAVGTAFDVRAESDHFEVTLMDGRVRVEAPAPTPTAPDAKRATDMTAGSRLIAEDAQRWRIVHVDLQKEAGWLRGELIFKHEKLADVIAELNRYSTKQIVLRDAKIADRPIIGSFKAGDIDEFVAAARSYGFVRVLSNDDKQVVLGAAS